ncbi:MAG: phosphatidate cytidylyltransferase [Anaerolineae bacterium]|nr:phosphatidate cytidylyltransferase [Anaerolineae bacterium]
MLRTRALSAVVLLALVGVPAALGGLPFLILVALAASLATWEYASLMRQSGHHPILPLSLLVALLLVAQSYWPATLDLRLVATLAVAGSLLATLWHRQPRPVTDWAVSLAGPVYLGLTLGHAVSLRNLDDGLRWLLVATVPIFVADSAAYFVGSAVGRHPWWPRHSPKKTWEGFAAELATSAVTVPLLAAWLVGLPWSSGLALGLLMGLLPPLGDLAESMIKRQAAVKDSSRLIPGHGGVLDRLDSLLISFPLVYYWAVLVV